MTGWMTTGLMVGSSSVAWETPAGVITSMAFGTLLGSNEQTGAVPPDVKRQILPFPRQSLQPLLLQGYHP